MTWRALYVASRSEKKVASRLGELGIAAYLPLKKEKRQWSDRKKIVITPLINGYVFVNLNEQQRELVFRAQGVLQYVKFNGEDAVIREEEIQVLKDIESKGYHADAFANETFFKGDRALIRYGQFKGLFGVVEHQDNKDVYTLQLESIGYSLRITLPSETLAKIRPTIN